MNKKNRRKQVPSPFQDNCLDQIPCVEKRVISHCDKQNEAKLALLDLGNDDSMFHADVILGEQNHTRNSLIERMKGYEKQERAKTAKRGVVSLGELNALMPIDNNREIQVNNFVDQKPPNIGNKKQRISMRNAPFFKFKENFAPFLRNIEGKKDEKTIVKLKKILKKLESPEKIKVCQQVKKEQHSFSGTKSKSNANKISQFCQEFLDRNVSASKEKEYVKFGSHQKALQTQNELSETVKFYQFRTGSKTSHQRHRSSFSRLPLSGTTTPTTFFYKPSKLTNKNMLFKRNSITTGESIHQKNYSIGLRKTSDKMIQQPSRTNLQRDKIQALYLQQEKIKEERKSRNLKNILFD